ncbi:MAG: cobalt ECF transporter T component CbiQ [Desulfobacteraceae bacterium]|nr:MAG: cobalt ECF transporter T component CbiQ [Desulfobacteraceae bacterium]
MVNGEPFSAGDSVIHRLDPRCRILSAAVLSFIIAVSKDFSGLAFAVLLSVLLAGAARIDLRAIAGRLLLTGGFVLFIWVVLPFTYDGEALHRLGPFTLTRPGVILALQITLKSFAILLIFTSLMATLSVATVGYALSHFHLPDKIVYLFMITYRYLFVLQQEFDRLHRAAKIRGFSPRTDLHTYRTYAYLVGMLFVRASGRADRVHQAMKCRGFSGKFHSLHDFSRQGRDRIFLVLTALSALVLAYLEWGGGGG